MKVMFAGGCRFQIPANTEVGDGDLIKRQILGLSSYIANKLFFFFIEKHVNELRTY